MRCGLDFADILMLRELMSHYFIIDIIAAIGITKATKGNFELSTFLWKKYRED